ncbi:MAG: DUF11 domain-containing protein [Planctomycetaceae bacterium]|nr:DUF11 domain-containing protein [Planctomycetaceae bacterium]
MIGCVQDAGRFLGLLACGIVCGCAAVPTGEATGSRIRPVSGLTGSALDQQQRVADRQGTGSPAGREKPAELSRVRPVSFPAMPREPNTTGQVGAIEEARVDQHPDEYVIDGGDRGNPIHYDSFLRYGVETEDTIAEFTDDTGKSHVLPTNRVAIYAPRFGVVRSVRLPIASFGVERMASSHRLVRESRYTQKVATRQHRQQEAVASSRVRSRASGLFGESITAGVSRSLRTREHVKLYNLFQETNRLIAGQMDQKDQARLAKTIDNVAAWATDLQPVVTATTAAGQSIQSTPWVAAITGVEVDQKEIGQLKILKLADRRIASSGDIVTFTLRFDNIGERPLHDVRIIDNLSPRLDYVPDSATLGFSDEDEKTPPEKARSGRITDEDNDEGSQVLVFELDEPLPGGVGGVITFQARVR